MSAYPRVPLGEICAINPRIRKSEIPEEDTLVSFVPMAAVDERFGMITAHEDRRLADVSKGFTAFEDGDVLFAKITPCMENGKVALVCDLTNGVGVAQRSSTSSDPATRFSVNTFITSFASYDSERKRNGISLARQANNAFPNHSWKTLRFPSLHSTSNGGSPTF